MTTFFSEQDLVKFGEYLLSKERKEKLVGDNPDKENLVYHSDIENFKELIKDDK